MYWRRARYIGEYHSAYRAYAKHTPIPVDRVHIFLNDITREAVYTIALALCIIFVFLFLFVNYSPFEIVVRKGVV